VVSALRCNSMRGDDFRAGSLSLTTGHPSNENSIVRYFFRDDVTGCGRVNRDALSRVLFHSEQVRVVAEAKTFDHIRANEKAERTA
jgi:hypothetical protein